MAQKQRSVSSVFNILVYPLYLILMIVAAMMIWFIISDCSKGNPGQAFSSWILYCIAPLLAYMAFIHPFFVFFNVTITENEMIYTWKFFPFRSLNIQLDDISGYYTMMVRSRDSAYRTYIPVLSNGKVLPLISSFYFDNAGDLMQAIKAVNKGELRFGWKRYFFDLHLLKRIR